MAARVTEKDLSRFVENSGRRPDAPPDPRTRLMPPKKSKYRNAITVVDGIKFHSKLESERYLELKMLRAGRKILYFLRQTPFALPGGASWRCDFFVVWGDELRGVERISVEDCKGYETALGRLKIKQVEELYGIKVKLIRAH